MKRQMVLLLGLLGIAAVMIVGCGPTVRTAYDAGRVYQKDGKCADAIEMYEQYVGNKKGTLLVPNALYNIGLCYEEMGQEAEAVEAFERVKARYPASDPAIWSHRAIKRIQAKAAK